MHGSLTFLSLLLCINTCTWAGKHKEQILSSERDQTSVSSASTSLRGTRPCLFSLSPRGGDIFFSLHNHQSLAWYESDLREASIKDLFFGPVTIHRLEEGRILSQWAQQLTDGEEVDFSHLTTTSLALLYFRPDVWSNSEGVFRELCRRHIDYPEQWLYVVCNQLAELGGLSLWSMDDLSDECSASSFSAPLEPLDFKKLACSAYNLDCLNWNSFLRMKPQDREGLGRSLVHELGVLADSLLVRRYIEGDQVTMLGAGRSGR